MIAWGEYSFAAFKEPRGFLRLLEWLFAICAFASTVNFTTSFYFEAAVACTPNSNTSGILKVLKSISYPFALDPPSENMNFNTKNLLECNNSAGTDLVVRFDSNVKSDSQFFVTTGVLCFLYTTALIGIYLYADKMYMDSTKGPIIDFFVSVIFALFWLSGTAAWWKGVSDLRYFANPNNWKTERSMFSPPLVKSDLTNMVEGSFGGLTVSILFGFINFILWATNLWFLYKETTWYESIMKRAIPATTASPSSST